MFRSSGARQHRCRAPRVQGPIIVYLLLNLFPEAMVGALAGLVK
jgi:hypothetical protein